MINYNEQDPEFPSQISAQQGYHTLNKIANFLEMKNIYINEFWQSNRNYASLQDLEKFCQLCGLKLGVHDQINLKNQLFFAREVISIYEFCDAIPQWKKKGNQMIADFLKERSQQLVSSLNSKIKNQRIKSSSSHPRPFSTTPCQKNPRMNSSSKEQQKQYKPNNSHKYLQQARLKNLQRQEQLAETIEKTKNQHQYNMLMKMNQLNQFHHKNKSSTTYRAYKNAEGIIKVRVFELESLKKELSIQEFQSQFKIYKKSTKENKCWERPKSIKQINYQELVTKTFHHAALSKNKKKEERQQELKNLLMNTVNLTKLLQEQIKIFKMKGIYGCEAI